MDLDTFKLFTEKLLQEVWLVMFQANKEYADEEDKLSNFKRIHKALKRNPRLIDLMPSDVVRVYMAKHVDSILSGISIREPLRGRVVDLIAYAVLLAAAEEEEGSLDNNGSSDKKVYFDAPIRVDLNLRPPGKLYSYSPEERGEEVDLPTLNSFPSHTISSQEEKVDPKNPGAPMFRCKIYEGHKAHYWLRNNVYVVCSGNFESGGSPVLLDYDCPIRTEHLGHSWKRQMSNGEPLTVACGGVVIATPY